MSYSEFWDSQSQSVLSGFFGNSQSSRLGFSPPKNRKRRHWSAATRNSRIDAGRSGNAAPKASARNSDNSSNSPSTANNRTSDVSSVLGLSSVAFTAIPRIVRTASPRIPRCSAIRNDHTTRAALADGDDTTKPNTAFQTEQGGLLDSRFHADSTFHLQLRVSFGPVPLSVTARASSVWHKKGHTGTKGRVGRSSLAGAETFFEGVPVFCHAAANAERKEIIRQARNYIQEGMRNGWGDTEFIVGLGANAVFYTLKSHLSGGFLQYFDRSRTVSVAGADGMTMVPKLFLDELDRLENEWGLI
jgi:hypothetical protein